MHYAHIDTVAGRLVRLTPSLPKDPTIVAVELTEEQTIGLLEARYKFSDFALLKLASGYKVVQLPKQQKLEAAKELVNLILNDSNVHLLKSASEQTEVSIKLNLQQKECCVELHPINGVENNMFTVLSRIGTEFNVEFYITRRNDPTYLLEYVRVDLARTWQDSTHTSISKLQGTYSAADISVYTKKLFDSYSSILDHSRLSQL